MRAALSFPAFTAPYRTFGLMSPHQAFAASVAFFQTMSGRLVAAASAQPTMLDEPINVGPREQAHARGRADSGQFPRPLPTANARSADAREPRYVLRGEKVS